MECRRKERYFDQLLPIYAYRGLIRDLVIAYKGKGRKSLSLFFAEKISERLRAEGMAREILVPVPPRQGKIRREGWDQIETIMRLLEKRHGHRVMPLLRRGTVQQEQKRLSEAERSIHIRGQFSLATTKITVPSFVILVDDICTTGATLSECSQVLKSAGADRVSGVVIAAD